MAKTDTEQVINIDTGVITFRNDENDTHCNCFPIRREHAAMVENGELEVAILVAAIKQHVRDKKDFDFDSYIKERRKLNVRHTALHVDPPKPELPDRSDELVSNAELKKAMEAAAAAENPSKIKDDAVADAVGELVGKAVHKTDLKDL